MCYEVDNAVYLCILYSSIIIVYVECIQVTMTYTLSVPSAINLALHIILIHFIIRSVAAAAPKSYYEYDSQQQINASKA